MKKSFRYFAIVWMIILALFNAITFIFPAQILGINRFKQPLFWIGYALIMLSLIVQIVFAYIACSKRGAEKVFLHIPLLKIGYIAVAASLLIGTLFMILPILPTWIGALVCLSVAGVFAALATKVIAAANIVSTVGDKVEKKMKYMKIAVAEVQSIMNRAATSEIKAEIKKAYEELRYSDYMSCGELSNIEQSIESHIKQLAIAVLDEDLAMVQVEVLEIVLLVKERNGKCKALK